jgi:superfamily II DNA or RNA helicase
MLRPYQKKAIAQTYESLRENNRVMLQLPTGSGKTHIAMDIIKQGLRNGRRINFGVDRLTLLDQTVDKFREHHIPVSVMQGNHPLYNPAQPVKIVSLQTLQRRDRSRWPTCDLWFFDEAHTHYGITSKVMNTWNALKYVGLSATPFTRGLGRVWEDLVVGATTEELMIEGHLSNFVAYGPSQPDLRGVRQSNGDYNSTDLEDRMGFITGDILQHFLKHGADKKTIGFTPTVRYAEHMAELFTANGIPSDYVCGKDSDERRIEVFNRYRAGDIQALFNCEVLIKGYDQPDIELGLVLRPTRSLSLHIQMLGRLLRTAPGKERAIILDHAGNIGRLGFPDDPLPTRLCDRERGVSSIDRRDPEEPTPWTCSQCYTLVPPRTRECPSCGFIPRQAPELEVREGSLRKLARGSMVEKQDVYSQLLELAARRKRKMGWVAHSYRSIFGVWPRRMVDRRKEPTQDLINWVKSQDIRYAKRRDRNAL